MVSMLVTVTLRCHTWGISVPNFIRLALGVCCCHQAESWRKVLTAAMLPFVIL